MVSEDENACALDVSCCLPRDRTDLSWPFTKPRHARLEAALYAIVRTTPPSTRNEAPVVADACSEQT